MDFAAIAILSLLIAAARREVETAGDLLIKQNVLHRMHDQRIEAKRKLTDIASALVGIKDRFQFLLILICPALHHSSLGEFQADVREADAVEQRGRVVLQNALNTIAHRRGEAFAIRNVALAAARNHANSLD